MRDIKFFSDILWKRNIKGSCRTLEKSNQKRSRNEMHTVDDWIMKLIRCSVVWHIFEDILIQSLNQTLLKFHFTDNGNIFILSSIIEKYLWLQVVCLPSVCLYANSRKYWWITMKLTYVIDIYYGMLSIDCSMKQ